MASVTDWWWVVFMALGTVLMVWGHRGLEMRYDRLVQSALMVAAGFFFMFSGVLLLVARACV